jgi:class 3 adenylate cyclase
VTVAPSRTNGFLFADLRDYTRYVETHGDQAGAALLEAYRVLVRSAVGEFGGAEIKTEGDSFYVVFPSASSAVQCGVAILAAAAESAERTGPPIRVGIGIHAGETVETAEGYVGSAVNVAARVCSQAKAGELLVTDTVRALTRTHLPVRFVDRRNRRLKGIAEPVVIYRVEPAAEAVASTARRSATGVGRPIRVAVLLIGLLIGGAAAGYILLAAQRPSTPPGGNATPSPSTFPNAAETDLLAQIPTSIRDLCRRTEAPAERVGTLASLRCDLGLTAKVDTVWYDQTASLQELADYLLIVEQRERLQRDTCGVDVARATGLWQVGSTHSGRLLCYTSGGHTWIEWSYDAQRILVRAVRSGDAPADWLALFEWWQQIRLFLLLR